MRDLELNLPNALLGVLLRRGVENDAADPEEDGEREPDEEHHLADLGEGACRDEQPSDAGGCQREPLLHRLEPKHQQLMDCSILLDQQPHAHGEQLVRMELVFRVIVHLVPPHPSSTRPPPHSITFACGCA